MAKARRWRSLMMALLVVQVFASSMALCREPLASQLDEGLQRALLDASRLEGPASNLSFQPSVPNIPMVAPVPSRPVAPELASGLLNDTLGQLHDSAPSPNRTADIDFEDDCVRRVMQILDVDLSAPAPSLVPQYLDETLEGGHQRWYLVTVAPGAFFDASKEFRVQGDRVADVVYGSESLDLFLVNVPTMRQFAQLFVGDIGAYVTHVFENFPMRLAVDSAKEAIGLPTVAFAGATGSGFSVAIVDTGVAPEHFPGRIVEEACFSSQELILAHGVASSSLCIEGRTVDDDWELVYQTAGFGFTEEFLPVGKQGAGAGIACTLANDCQHGTQVAYIAAGGVRPGPQSGVAQGARIVAIQVGSKVPPGYCPDAVHDDDPCVVIFPLDVLRALRHLESLVLPLDSKGAPLVAVNLSIQLGRLCAKPIDGVACHVEADDAKWSPASYRYPCPRNPMAPWVRKLRTSGVWTVIAAGNRNAAEKLGFVASPACIADALTVAGSDDAFRLSDTSMLGSMVDFVAPGIAVATPATVASNTGTSFAAPQVSGLLALMAERYEGCREDVDDGVDWLMSRRGPVEIDEDDIPFIGIGVDPHALAVTVHADDAIPCSNLDPDR